MLTLPWPIIPLSVLNAAPSVIAAAGTYGSTPMGATARSIQTKGAAVIVARRVCSASAGTGGNGRGHFFYVNQPKRCMKRTFHILLATRTKETPSSSGTKWHVPGKGWKEWFKLAVLFSFNMCIWWFMVPEAEGRNIRIDVFRPPAPSHSPECPFVRGLGVAESVLNDQHRRSSTCLRACEGPNRRCTRLQRTERRPVPCRSTTD
jgi:hypothetical protein